MKPYLAHIAEDKREQTVMDHLSGTASMCAMFAADFEAEEQGRLAGSAHDLGKFSGAFQYRVRGDPHRVDHSTAGAVECFDLRQPYAAFAVAGHHGGLPDGGSRTDSPDEPTFLGRMRRACLGKLPPYDAWRQHLQLPAAALPNCPDQASAMFFTRMLYSCLVDADFLDTESFMNGKEKDRGGGDDVALLLEKLLSHTAKWFPPENDLDQARCAILRRCLEQGECRSPGLFTLTVPTGGGKTTASLAFALRHAHAHGLRRIIYVIPYTSIIEQNAKVFRDILGERNVLEHHSGILYDPENELDPSSARYALATENWDMPVVVTTAVQFFESLFSNRPSKCRKLHNLAKSVIIFDEAQMLPLPHLRPCVYAISQLVKEYGASAVLCTATQPALNDLFGEFLPDRPPIELCPADTAPAQPFQRVSFERRETLTVAELSQQLSQRRQVLCIMNTRKEAQAVYQALDREGSFHLSTLMYPAHRTAVLKEVKARLAAGLPCRVVSTSLIEAGVDIDFPAVFREEAGLDSILQAAGRCNRNGKRSAKESVVTIFRSEAPIPPLFRRNVDAGRLTLDHTSCPDSPEAITRYFHELMDIAGKKGQDKRLFCSLSGRKN